MRLNGKCLGFAIGVGVTAMACAGSIAMAKTVTEKGTGSDTFVSANFSYDLVVPAVLVNGSGKDSVGGSFTIQNVTEWAATTSSCTASDNSAGTTYDLVQSTGVTSYKKGQVFYSAAGASGGTQCISNTTGVSSGTFSYTVTGGNGKFASSTGAFTVTLTGTTLAAPGMPPGINGLFGANQFSVSGSISE